MIKLTYNATYKFNTADIYMACDPPIFFEALSRPPAEWTNIVVSFNENEDIEQAKRCLALALRSVSQFGESWPINGLEDIEALRAAIEEGSPGQGDHFITSLGRGHANYHYSRIEELAGNSDRPSPALSDGDARNGTNGQTAKQPKRRRARQSSDE